MRTSRSPSSAGSTMTVSAWAARARRASSPRRSRLVARREAYASLNARAGRYARPLCLGERAREQSRADSSRRRSRGLARAHGRGGGGSAGFRCRKLAAAWSGRGVGTTWGRGRHLSSLRGAAHRAPQGSTWTSVSSCGIDVSSAAAPRSLRTTTARTMTRTAAPTQRPTMSVVEPCLVLLPLPSVFDSCVLTPSM